MIKSGQLSAVSRQLNKAGTQTFRAVAPASEMILLIADG
jgi:hypothetical protein